MKLTEHNQRVLTQSLFHLSLGTVIMLVSFAGYRWSTSIPNSAWKGFPAFMAGFLLLALAVGAGYLTYRINKIDIAEKLYVFAGSNKPATAPDSDVGAPLISDDMLSHEIERAQRIVDEDNEKIPKKLDTWED